MPWSPWRGDDPLSWESLLPQFKRPVFEQLLHDLGSLNQMISITGPRRVGKSTIQKQIIHHLINQQNVPPSAIAYFSFDDPALFRGETSGGEMFEGLMQMMLKHAKESGGTAYLMLDEIQTLDRWEQYLKKYYDLDYPFKFLISGSASSPIFKKSRESLLGRVKDYHLLPFSFREYVQYEAEKECIDVADELIAISRSGEQLKGMFARNPEHLDVEKVLLNPVSDALWDFCNRTFNSFVVEGGFPEVWNIESKGQKIDYLYDNQVKKVIMEDLVLATELRKPEELKRFYISLLETPGREVNKSKLSQELGIGVRQIDKYLPLLEMTDLVRHANKFRNSPMRVRTGSQKFFPIDMALRNAVLRIGDEVLDDDSVLGLYAETFVFNALRKWDGVLAVDYYRTSAQVEVDFIVHVTPSRYIPVEVKYKRSWRAKELKGVKKFTSQHECANTLVVTKNREDFGSLSNIRSGDDSGLGCFCIPLLHFLLLMD